jgi:excisionase family DNA binding protein
MQDPVTDDLVIAPQHNDVGGLRVLADALDTADTVFVRSDDGDAVALPAAARDGLERLVSYLAADMAVTMKPYDEILTTRQAAELLGMSRPYLVQLLETGATGIPFEKVGPGAGGHRRIRLRDVLAYRQDRAAENETRIDRSLKDVPAEASETVYEASQPVSATARISTR